MPVRDAAELTSLPVVIASEGRSVGRVKDVLFDPERQTLLGLLVDGNGSGASFVRQDAIRALGAAAVMVASPEDVRSASDERTRAAVDGGLRLRGTMVLTEHGDPVGEIRRVMMKHDGTVVGYEVRGGFLQLGRRRIAPADVLKIGPDAMIVRCSLAQQTETEAPPAPTRPVNGAHAASRRAGGPPPA